MCDLSAGGVRGLLDFLSIADVERGVGLDSMETEAQCEGSVQKKAGYRISFIPFFFPLYRDRPWGRRSH